MPFIAATAKLPADVRRGLLVKVSRALLDFCDHHGAAECLKYALGLDRLEPSAELDRVIEAGLKIIAETADDDDDDDLEDDDDGDDLEDETERVEELIRIVEEDHQSPQASPSERAETEACNPCMHTSGATSPKTTYRRIFEFIDAHQGCLTRDITRHMKGNVRKYLDEMDRLRLIVRVSKRDQYACVDGREKRHYTADQHVGHIGRYGVGG